MDSLGNLVQLIEQGWSERRLLVVGDVMLDRYIWGGVGRISPEAPVPIVRVERQNEQPGGAANVAMNLARLGAKVTVAGYSGGDSNELLLVDCLKRNGVDTELVACAEFPTVTKTRILGGKQQMLRLDSERLGERPAGEQKKLIARVLELVAEADAVVLSDYAKGTLTAELCRKVIEAAAERKTPVLVDPKQADFGFYRGATTVCPNLSELKAALRLRGVVELEDQETLLGEAGKLVAECGLEFLTATLSEKGIALVWPERRMVVPATARQVFDVSGAGDTVIAVLALCLASGVEPAEAVHLANLAAGVVVGKVGTVPVERAELLAAMAPELALHAGQKVLGRRDAAQRIALWKQNGERVVFTNGCFDLLHVGHITLLEEARRAGDRLVVAVNSDSSVRGLKGTGRPVVGEQERARVLAALAAVDAVVIFDEPTPLELVEALRPNVLVKGGDYTLESIVGAREVLSWGGEVKIVATVAGHSTTRLIEKGAGQ